MEKRMAFLLVVTVLWITSCASSSQPPSITTESTNPSATSLPTTTATPRPIVTQITTQTATSVPTLTPSFTPSPTSRSISRDDWKGLQVIDFIGNGDFFKISWSDDEEIMILGFNHSIWAVDTNTWEKWLITRKESKLTNALIREAGSEPASVISGDYGGKHLYSWGLATGELEEKIEIEHGYLAQLVRLSDGTGFLTGGSSMNIFDMDDFDRIMSIKSSGTSFVSFSPDGHYLAAGGGFGNEKHFEVYDLDTHEEIIDQRLDTEIHSVDFVADDILVFGTEKGEVMQWKIPENYLSASTWAPPYCPDNEAIKLSYLGNNHISIYCDHLVQIWNISKKDLLWEHEFDYHKNERFKQVSAGPNGKFLAVVWSKDNYKKAELYLEIYSKSFSERIAKITIPNVSWCLGHQVGYDGEDPFYHFLSEVDDRVSVEIPPNGMDKFDVDIPAGYEVVSYIRSYDGQYLALFLTQGFSREMFMLLQKVNESGAENTVIKKKSTGDNNDPYSHLSAMTFNQHNTLVSIAMGHHIITWNLETGDLISDIDVSPHKLVLNYPLSLFYIDGMVYTDNDMLIFTARDGGMYFLDPVVEKWVGKLRFPYDYGEFLTLNKDGTKLVSSTCGSGGI